MKVFRCPALPLPAPQPSAVWHCSVLTSKLRWPGPRAQTGTRLSSLALLAPLLCSAGPLPQLEGGPPEAEVPQLPEGAVCAVQGHALGPLPGSSCDNI